MKLSIIIPYYNKRQILFNTLKSIEHFVGDYPIETIIVDDGSNDQNKIDDYPSLFPALNIKLLVLSKPTGKWRAPVISYNTGFLNANGNVFMLNGADCMHMGNMIKYTFDHFKEGMYLSFSSYRGTDELNDVFAKLDWNNLDALTASLPKSSLENWHVHNRFFVKLYPFVACLSKTDIERLSGYDERYADGVAYDDDDIVDRITNIGLDIRLVDDPFCLHQKHPYTQYYSNVNRDLYAYLKKHEPNRTKALHNKIYVR